MKIGPRTIALHFVCGALLSICPTSALAQDVAPRVKRAAPFPGGLPTVEQDGGRQQAIAEIGKAADAFLDALSEDQRAKANLPFETDERLKFRYIPVPAEGITLGELTPTQSLLAHGLIGATLGAKGMLKTEMIMSLEEILEELEAANASPRRQAGFRAPEKYTLTVFGDPASGTNWAWRLQGHHVSINITIADPEAIATSPQFFGAEPHEVMEGGRAKLKVLAAEEHFARELLALLEGDRRERAILSDTAPRDIFSAMHREVEFEEPPQGLPMSDMTDEQQVALGRLVEVYIQNVRPELAQLRRDQMADADPARVFFAWMGSDEVGEPHYYRVQTPEFLIEYDNIQRNANHSHTVWRDYDGDFGRDLLAEHHAASHQPDSPNHSH